MVDQYYNYIRITQRNVYIDINGKKALQTTSMGFLGSICSAQFWIIAFNAAINVLNTHGVLGIGFADDCVGGPYWWHKFMPNDEQTTKGCLQT